MRPEIRKGLQWLGRAYSKESSEELIRRGTSIGLYNGYLRSVRAELHELTLPQRAMRSFVFAATGLVAMTCFRVFGRGEFRRLDELMHAVERAPREKRPLITVSNHTATIDDPVLWGALPWSWVVLNDANRRWLWAAQEICHANRLVALGFGLGHCVPIIRGGGLEQPTVPELQERVDSAKWVHVFSEALCNQTGKVVPFRWGVGRLIVHSPVLPRVMPMAHTGMQNMFPQHLSKAYPRFCKVRAAVDDEVDVEDIWERAQSAHRVEDAEQKRLALEALYAEATSRVEERVAALHDTLKEEEIRSA
eukprot:TRINITY_DN11708_c0_g1_i1.p1 TRINITY_DN11708_c0_g1~~TRINITY_DN11708_c0_g1_i1.p1  ORF type:complete len:325 (+),score=112.85 TRINITY_DN11708_c0_g1_i1:60-977(+)